MSVIDYVNENSASPLATLILFQDRLEYIFYISDDIILSGNGTSEDSYIIKE